MDLTLPFDYATIERILPHRYPFLLVDRITELEVDKRIVGIKNVSLNERYLSHVANGSPVLPPTILTEAIAQVGAIMILAKPENRQRLPYFMGIKRVRFRRPVHPGDVVGDDAGAEVARLLPHVQHQLGADCCPFAVGLLAALAAGRLLMHTVDGVQSTEPFTFAIVIPILVVAALLASFGPARRASRIDPMSALRQE